MASFGVFVDIGFERSGFLPQRELPSEARCPNVIKISRMGHTEKGKRSWVEDSVVTWLLGWKPLLVG